MKDLLASYGNLLESDLNRFLDFSPEYLQGQQDATLFRTFSAFTEVSGKMILKMLGACEGYLDQVQQILAAFGLTNLHPEDWYPEQTFLDALCQISDCTSPVLLNQMGAALADTIQCLSITNLSAAGAPLDASVEESILLLNQQYHRWHQHGEAGDIHLIQSIPTLQSVIVQCRHPYPCELDMGLLKRLVQRVTQKAQVMVFHDYRQTQRCRKTGAGACTLVVSY